MKLGKFKS